MIIIINGPCGVGKTSIAKELAAQFDKSVHIRADDIHNLITDSQIIPEQIAVTDENIKDLVKNFKKYGYKKIIIDNVYETAEHLERVMAGLGAYDSTIIPVRISCSLEENLYRNSIRPQDDIMEDERVKELYQIFQAQGDQVGKALDTTGLTVASSVQWIIEFIKEKGALNQNGI